MDIGISKQSSYCVRVASNAGTPVLLGAGGMSHWGMEESQAFCPSSWVQTEECALGSLKHQALTNNPGEAPCRCMYPEGLTEVGSLSPPPADSGDLGLT